jgi:hypothetical protein
MLSGLCNDPGAKDIAAPHEKKAGSNGITDPAKGEHLVLTPTNEH